ncbi:MAG: hypothetical protein M3347_09295 [Armatimonadota bacterium]|nr:hypothetical protein [Armatimonadota bacterium]
MMSAEDHQYCPICHAEVPPNPRYPRYVCPDCEARAADENDRALKFYNESFSGGFIAQYADTGEKRDSHICFIDGIKCWADEARFGGIVIQPMQEPAPRGA